MTECVAVFVAALLSCAHCIGMCGGFAAAIGATKQPLVPGLARQIIFSAGRVFTYAFLGAVGGFGGLYLSQFDAALINVQQGFSILAGVMMLFIGASLLGIPRFGWLSSLGVGELFAPMFKHFLNTRNWGGFFLAGLANGFLPCGLVYAFLARAVASGNVIKGAVLMTAFGLGTAPAMVAIGCGTTLVSHAMRARVYKLAACFILLVGVVTIIRAFSAAEGDCCYAPSFFSLATMLRLESSPS